MVSPSWRSKLKEIYPSDKEWSQGQSFGNRYYLMQHEGGPHERFKITMNKNLGDCLMQKGGGLHERFKITINKNLWDFYSW